MKKILITGASGFVGKFLVEEALGRGLEVHAGVRASSSLRGLKDDRIKLFTIDFDNPEELKQNIDAVGFDYVIQNAGATRAPKAADYFRVNADYSERLAQIALDQPDEQLKKFVLISSLEAYGPADHQEDQVVTDDSTPAPLTTYGKSKLRGEQALKKIEGLPYLVMRPTAVFGPGERDLLTIFETIKKYKVAPVVGSSKIKYTFVYVKDLARAVLDATLSEHTGKSYFVSDGRIHSIKEFTQPIAETLGIKPFRFTVPYFILDIVSSVTQVLDRITGNKSLINPEQVAKMKVKSWDCDIAPLVRDTGYQPQYTLEQALKETTEWYVEQGWI